MVNSQLKIFTPVGMEVSIVTMPTKALTLAPAPMVKKRYSYTIGDNTVIETVAYTIAL